MKEKIKNFFIAAAVYGTICLVAGAILLYFLNNLLQYKSV